MQEKKKNLLLVIMLILIFMTGFQISRRIRYSRQIQDFLVLYYMQQTQTSTAENIHFLGSDASCAAIYHSGETPRLVLYRYRVTTTGTQVSSATSGDYAISGGLSVNHAEYGGKHIYYGNLKDSHWDPVNNIAIPLDWQILMLTDSKGKTSRLDVTDTYGFLCVLDDPLADFQGFDRSGEVILNLETYLQQGYSISPKH